MASRFLRSGALALLALGLVALIPACGDEKVPTPTTPPPAPAAPPAPEPPGAPAGFQVSASGEDFIEWSWTAVEGADAYDVQLSLDAEFDGSDPVAAVTATSFRNPLPLPPETTAHARVRSAAGEGGDRLTSGWSDPVSGMTTPPALTRPETPAGLRVSAYGEDFIEWSWSEVPGAHGYQVEHSRNEQFMNSTTADVDADTRSYRVEDLPSDTSVYLHVRSFVGTGDARLWSEWSVHRTGMTEAPAAMAPATPTIADVDFGEDYIEWSWNAVAGAEGYEVQFSLDGQFSGATTVDRAAAQRSYRKEGLDPETRGYLRVRAYVMDDGERLHSMWSEAATAVTEASSLMRPVAPQNMRVTKTGSDFIEWSWDPVPDVAGYDVLYSDNAAITKDDPIKELSAEDLSYTKEGLAPDTEHYLQVRAFVGEGARRLESPWTPDGGRRGRTELAPPAVPANLRVDDALTDHDSIGWRWDAVADADDYEFQFGLETPFPDEDSDGTTRGRTSVVRDGIASQTNGYLRVRSVVGTGTSARRSDWSRISPGRTEAAPAPTRTPLSAPEVTADTLRNTTITLSWGAVDDVDRYEVEQQSAAGTWGDATCGTGGAGFVTNEQCVASELTRGTNYQFRVRAHPDSDDETKRVSEWSLTVSAATTGRPPVTIGDDGGLNLRWRSEDEDQSTPQITWTWDPVDDRAQQPLIDHYVALLRPTNDRDDCPNLSSAPLPAADSVTDEDDSYNKWHDLDSDISFTLTVVDSDADGAQQGEVRGLCVVRTWEDERKIRQFGDVAVVWGSAVPFSSNGKVQRDGSTRVTTSIGWEFQRDAGFDYVLRLLSTDAKIGRATSDPADCADGKSVDSPDAVGRQNVDIFHTETSLKPYMHYQLCVRAENDYGASEWTFVGGVEEGAATSLPAAPSAPALQTNQSDITTGSDRRKTVNSLFWSVRHKAGTPEDGDHYNIVIFRSAEDSIPRNDQIQTTCDTADELTAGSGQILLGTDEKFEISSGFDRYSLNSGLDLEYGPTDALLDSTDAFDQYYFYMCIRADDTPAATDGNHGPWTISRTTGFVGGRLLTPAVSGLAVEGVGIPRPTAAMPNPTFTSGRFTATWSGNDAATRYEIQYVIGDSGSISDPTDSTSIRTTTDTEYVVTQAFPGTSNRGTNTTFQGRFRVRYYRTAGGITLRGDWSSVVLNTVSYP